MANIAREGNIEKDNKSKNRDKPKNIRLGSKLHHKAIVIKHFKQSNIWDKDFNIDREQQLRG